MGFDSRVWLEFPGTQFSPDGGLPLMRELDDAPGLSGPASAASRDSRQGRTTGSADWSGKRSMGGSLAGYRSVHLETGVNSVLQSPAPFTQIHLGQFPTRLNACFRPVRIALIRRSGDFISVSMTDRPCFCAVHVTVRRQRNVCAPA